MCYFYFNACQSGCWPVEDSQDNDNRAEEHQLQDPPVTDQICNSRQYHQPQRKKRVGDDGAEGKLRGVAPFPTFKATEQTVFQHQLLCGRFTKSLSCDRCTDQWQTRWRGFRRLRSHKQTWEQCKRRCWVRSWRPRRTRTGGAERAGSQTVDQTYKHNGRAVNSTKTWTTWVVTLEVNSYLSAICPRTNAPTRRPAM